MALTHLLDTSVFSQPIKDRPLECVLERWSMLNDSSLAVSSVCLAEVLQRLEKRQSPKYWRRYHELLEGKYPVLAFDQPCAQVFGKLAAALHRQGRPRSIFDLQIAATARRHGLIVATLNIKHFDNLPSVRVENWSKA